MFMPGGAIHSIKRGFSGKLSSVTANYEDKVPEAFAEQTAVPSLPAVIPAARAPATPLATATGELGGRDGPEPTRFGDWELRGRCIDF
jgi:hypothetical protein